MARQEDFGWFAGDEAKGRDVADRVAGQVCGKRLRQRQADGSRHALPPGFRAEHETNAGEREDGQQSPADPTHAGGDLRPPDIANGIGEQQRTCNSRQGGDHRSSCTGRHLSDERPVNPQLPTPNIQSEIFLGVGGWELGVHRRPV